MDLTVLIMTISFCGCCLSTATAAENQKDDLQLLMVHALWRHGDRTPVKTFPNDTKKWWREGWGQLTALGMRQQYALGQVLADRYIGKDKLLSNMTYDMRSIYVRSTDVNRTLLSAYSNLAGMFSKGEPGLTMPDDQPWPGTWQPIPVHTVDRDTDFLLNVDVKCPVAEDVTKIRKESDEWIEMTKKNKEFLQWLEKESGVERTLGIDQVWSFWDSYVVQTTHKVPTPAFYTNETLDTLRNLTFFDDNSYFLPEIVTRLRGGPLLTEIIQRMQARVKCIGAKHDRCWEKSHETELCCQMQNRKYYAYSAHDVTVMAALRTLHSVPSVLHGRGFPHYASCVLFELWHNATSGRSFVKDTPVPSAPIAQILYQRGDYALPEAGSLNGFDLPFEDITHTVSGCPAENGTMCELQRFADRSEKFMVSDWRRECGFGNELGAQGACANEVWIILLAVVAGVLLVLLLVTCYVNRMRAMQKRQMIISSGHVKW